MHVVLDLRPLQEPDRGPVTAAYLEELLRAFAAEPLPGELFTFILQTGLSDPSETIEGLAGLDVVGRRWLPPTRLLRSGALTIEPFLLRTASVAAGWRSHDRGAAGTVYHAAGGAVPLSSRLPLVVSLLDIAPWELPDAYQRTPAARFGQRLRARIVQGAAAVIVPSGAGVAAVRRLLHVRRSRVAMVAAAPRPLYRHPEAAALAAAAEERERRGVPDRYFIYTGRYDARQDLVTLLGALRIAAAAVDRTPPSVLVVGTTPDDRASIAQLAAAEGVGELLRYAPALPPATVAGLVAGARAVLVPALTDIAGLTAPRCDRGRDAGGRDDRRRATGDRGCRRDPRRAP